MTIRATGQPVRALSCLHRSMLLSALAGALLTSPVVAQGTTPTVADIAWIAGTWSATMGAATVEEHWVLASNAMLGMGRTLSGDRMVSFEYLRIVAREDGIFYIAQPNGRSPTEFRLTMSDSTRVVFENPDHDFPKRIVYTRQGDEAMTAWVDSGEGSNDARSFTYGRVRL